MKVSIRRSHSVCSAGCSLSRTVKLFDDLFCARIKICTFDVAVGCVQVTEVSPVQTNVSTTKDAHRHHIIKTEELRLLLIYKVLCLLRFQ